MKQFGVVMLCLLVWVVVSPIGRKNLPEVREEYTEESVSEAEVNFDEEKVLFAFEVPESGSAVRVVDNGDYISFFPSSVTVYVDSEKYCTKDISNDGKLLGEWNFEAYLDENTVYLTLKGEEQEDETIAIPIG